MATHVGLIRGINVGKAKRVSMAELAKAIEALGYSNVRTLLNSGNVVFTAPGVKAGDAASRLEQVLVERLGVSAKVMVLTARELDAIVAANPFADVADNPSRYLVGVLASKASTKLVEPLLAREWAPEALATGPGAVYLWCPNMVTGSPLMEAIGKVLKDGVTTRNWATMTKLLALTRT